MFDELDSSLFDWVTWRAGNPWDDFRIPCRTLALIANADILRRYAVGWCSGERLLCRPKAKHTAVMFFYSDRYFWFHLRKEEFDSIWTI